MQVFSFRNRLLQEGIELELTESRLMKDLLLNRPRSATSTFAYLTKNNLLEV